MNSAPKTPVLDRLLELGADFYPSCALWEVTHRCNCDCAYCYIGDKGAAVDLDTGTMKLILDKLCDGGVPFLTVTGGEPFIRDDIIPILQYAIRKDFWRISIMTNGTLLSEKHIEFIADNRDIFNRTVSVTAFSHEPGVNDGYFKLPGALDSIVRNCEKLMSRGITILMKVAVMDFNVRTFQRTYDFFKNMGMEVVASFFKIPQQGEYQNVSGDCNRLPFIREYLRNLDGKMVRDQVDDFRRKIAGGPQTIAYCQGRVRAVAIGPDGGLKPCVSFSCRNEGNILEEGTLRDILKRNTLHRRIRELKAEDMTRCRSCEYSGFCKQCLADTYNESLDFTKPSSSWCNWAHALAEQA